MKSGEGEPWGSGTEEASIAPSYRQAGRWARGAEGETLGRFGSGLSVFHIKHSRGQGLPQAEKAGTQGTPPRQSRAPAATLLPSATASAGGVRLPGDRAPWLRPTEPHHPVPRTAHRPLKLVGHLDQLDLDPAPLQVGRERLDVRRPLPVQAE